MADEIMLTTGRNEVAREYGLSVLKGAISAVPFVGGALNEVLFEARSRIKQARLNCFFEGVASDFALLDEAAIKREFLYSEEFSDLLEDLCLRVAKSAADEKQKHFRRVLVNAVQGRHDPDFAAMFMAILADMTEAEIVVLAALQDYPPPNARQQDGAEETNGIPWVDYTKRPWGLDGTLARQVVQSLLSKGLLVDDSFGRFDAVAFQFVARSELGARFLAWLQGSASSEAVDQARSPSGSSP